MQIVLTRDPREVLERAWPFLEARIERNVLATVLLGVAEGRFPSPDALFAYGVERGGGEVRFAALRTPSWSMLADGLERERSRDAAAELVARWLGEDPELPGVSARPGTARPIAAAWERITGGSAVRRVSEAVHALTGLAKLERPAPGTLRPARGEELTLMMRWLREFEEEAEMAVTGQREEVVVSRIERGELLVWDDGRAVSMVGVNPAVAGVVRVGPVYTPPDLRGRGYATTAVAEASRRALEAGAHTCSLFTDLANPTSNKIYAGIGYRRIADWEELEFERG